VFLIKRLAAVWSSTNGKSECNTPHAISSFLWFPLVEDQTGAFAIAGNRKFEETRGNTKGGEKQVWQQSGVMSQPFYWEFDLYLPITNN